MHVLLPHLPASQQVILGGGRRHWLPKVARDPEQTNEEGRRLDGRNLIDDWLRDKKRRGVKAEYVWNKGQLEHVNTRTVDQLLGLQPPIRRGVV
uniref:alkaline phosphatase n=1 Tax=Timema bartmani TaxID=61472 RepID=A0A7R9HV58_9NEOP|nr:unnamed protein product [Timema bartmani]